MDAPTKPLGKSARLRRWFARHLLAMTAAAIVLGVLSWKNQYQEVGELGDRGYEQVWGDYGWPRECMHRVDAYFDSFPIPSSTSRYAVTSWPSFIVDAFIADMSLIATWVLFSRTQRRCERWWQLSLASLLAFVLLATVVCTVLNSESLWGW